MCLIIFEEKAEVQDQYPLSLNPVHKADDPIQDHNRNIGPFNSLNTSNEAKIHPECNFPYLMQEIAQKSPKDPLKIYYSFIN